MKSAFDRAWCAGHRGVPKSRSKQPNSVLKARTRKPVPGEHLTRYERMNALGERPIEYVKPVAKCPRGVTGRSSVTTRDRRSFTPGAHRELPQRGFQHLREPTARDALVKFHQGSFERETHRELPHINYEYPQGKCEEAYGDRPQACCPLRKPSSQGSKLNLEITGAPPREIVKSQVLRHKSRIDVTGPTIPWGKNGFRETVKSPETITKFPSRACRQAHNGRL